MTDASIIGRDVTRDDAGKLETVGTVWWYPQYETTDPVDALMEYGRIVFPRAPNAIPSRAHSPRSDYVRRIKR